MQIKEYTAVFPVDEQGEVMVLKRAEWKKFAPGQYTGIGGTVEAEDKSIEDSLMREWEEETEIPVAELRNITLRGRMLIVGRENGDHLVYYFTADVSKERLKDLSCNEGELTWTTMDEFGQLDLVPTVQICHPYIFDKTLESFAGVNDIRTGETSFVTYKKETDLANV